MSDETQLSFYDSLGLESEEEQLARKRRQAADERRRDFQAASQGGKQFAGGYALGQGLAKLLGKGKQVELDTTETRRARIFNEANEAAISFERLANQEGQVLTAQERLDVQARTAMDAARKHGDYELVGMISQQQVQQQAAKESASAELEKIRTESDENRANATYLRGRNGAGKGDQRGKFVNAWDTDAKYGAAPQTGWINPETGNLHQAANPAAPVTKLAGNFTTYAPRKPPAKHKPATPKSSVSPKAAENHRISLGAATKFSAVATDMAGVLREVIKVSPDGTTGPVFDGAGKLTAFLTKTFDFVDAATSFVRNSDPDYEFLGIGDEGGRVMASSPSSAEATSYFDKHLKSIPQDQIGDIAESWGLDQSIVDSIRANGDVARRYGAMLVRLTWANMRIFEPQGRQFSDQDFKNAYTISGGASSNLKQLSDNMVDQMTEADRTFYINYRTLPDYAKSGPRPIIDPAALKYYEEVSKPRFESVYGKIDPFRDVGTTENEGVLGEGIEPEQEQEETAMPTSETAADFLRRHNLNSAQ